MTTGKTLPFFLRRDLRLTRSTSDLFREFPRPILVLLFFSSLSTLRLGIDGDGPRTSLPTVWGCQKILIWTLVSSKDIRTPSGRKGTCGSQVTEGYDLFTVVVGDYLSRRGGRDESRKTRESGDGPTLSNCYYVTCVSVECPPNVR